MKTNAAYSHREGQVPTVREITMSLMRRLGLRTVFANPGSTELPMFRDFPADFRYVLGLQEATVVGMADGYAQATRHAAFVNLHSAAGVGNAMGAIFTAFRNRTPLVITAGQQARSILPYAPFLSSPRVTELPMPYVKWSVEPARAQDVPLALAQGYHLAMAPPCGPVLISVPVDDWDRPGMEVPEREMSQRVRPDPALIARAAEALRHARRPAFVAGSSVDRDDAWHALVTLAELHQARVFNAPMSGRSSFPEHHPLFAGTLPAMREHIVQTLGDHDVVLVVGAAAFTYHVEGSGPHIAPSTVVYQLTEAPDVGVFSGAGTSVIGSIRLALEDLLQEPPPARTPPPRRARPSRVEPSTPMSAAYVLQTLDDVREETDVIVEEAPTVRPLLAAHLPIKHPASYYAMDSGGLGFGMPAAVGIALAGPDRRVICLIGDGSSMYSFQALWSAVQWNLPVTFVVVNNHGYAALKGFAGVFGFTPEDPVQGTDLPGIDFVALANGLGCTAQRVSSPHELRHALETALEGRRPHLVEVEIA